MHNFEHTSIILKIRSIIRKIMIKQFYAEVLEKLVVIGC